MLRAMKQIRRMRGGAQSHLMRCSDGNYYVVKFQNNPQHRRILVNELLGTKLAARLGLPTTPVVIVKVSEDLIRMTPDLAQPVRRPYPSRRRHCAGSTRSLRCLGGETEADDPVIREARKVFKELTESSLEPLAWAFY
jgi:hypothetical protein